MGYAEISQRFRRGPGRDRREPSPALGQGRTTAAPSLIAVTVVGVVAVGLGLLVMASGPITFSLAGAYDGVVSQLSTTLLPAASVALATTIDLAAGAVLIRGIRGAPFSSLTEALLAGLVGAVAKGSVLLFGLGGIGHFGLLPLVLADLALIVGGLLLRPFVAAGKRAAPPWPAAAWILPLLLWSMPLVLQLASPVVPFLDVLPNHVAPLEHLRVYGSYEQLAVSPSPIYGPSRLFLGYIGLVGSVTTLTGLPATLAVAAFALPLSVLLAAGGYHLCRSLGGHWAGYWSLLTVPLTFTFLRLPDARATVLAFPVAAAALALTLRERGGEARPLDKAAPWDVGHRSRAMLLAAAIGATILVHPVIGAFTAGTVALLGVAGSTTLRRPVLAGLLGSLLVALPQAAVMVGVQAPAWAALPAWPIGLLIAGAIGIERPGRGTRGATAAGATAAATASVTASATASANAGVAPGRVRLSSTVVKALLAGLVGASIVASLLLGPQLASRLLSGLLSTAIDHPVLLLGLAIAALTVRDRRTWLVIGSGLLVAAAASIVAGVTPTDTRLGESIHFELPKSVGYWWPWVGAIAGGLGLAAMWARTAWSGARRVAVAAVFVGLAALPLRGPDIEPRGIEEHRYAESAAVLLMEAERGYWIGYPDPRRLVDEDGAALIEAIRREQDAQRMGSSTALLHVVPSFQPWIATPLGVFAGVLETTATEDPEDSLHTVGGRLRDIADLDALLGPSFPYLVIEGYGLEQDYLARATAAGYEQIAEGDGWTLLRLAPAEVAGEPRTGPTEPQWRREPGPDARR